MSRRVPSHYSLRFNLGYAFVAGLLFWIQFTAPARAVGCWALLGAMLFLAVSYTSRFWSSVTGIFGFEGGLLAGMLLGVQNHWLWILGGFAGALGLTLLEHLRLSTMPPEKGSAQALRVEVLIREIGLGAFAGSVAASMLHSEVSRLYLLGGLIIVLRLLLDKKPASRDEGP